VVNFALDSARQYRLFDCKLCPGRGTDQEIGGVGARMARWQVCRSCDFWLTCLGYMVLGDQDPDGRRVLRIAGRHYMTWNDEQGRPPEIGYTSPQVRLYVLLDDPAGTVHTAHWLWLMGTIPDRFRDQLPDSAAFVEAAT
jgi:hypothetical protein